MPTYRRGVTLSDAVAAAAAIAPIQRAMIYCYELYHPSLNGVPFRFADNMSTFNATLEGTAPFNASTPVDFLALPLTAQRPEESDAADAPSVAISADNVSSLLNEAIKGSRGSLTPWTIIERLYASDDRSAPAKLPVLTYELTEANITGSQAQIKAGYGDPVNVSIPRLTFKREEYPGLEA